MFMTSFNLIIPELNDFITQLDGIEYKGLIISLFTITAAISRPFSGKMADFVGRKSTMYIGAVISALVTLLYPLSGSVLFFLVLRFFHGFSTGFLPTGATALVTDLLPDKRRGHGMGVFGTGISLGIGVGQFLGTPTRDLLGMNGLFLTSAALSMISFILIIRVKETLENPTPFHFSIFKIGKKDIVEKQVYPAAVVMFLTAACSGLLFVLSPDMSVYLGIDNKGWFFIFYVFSTILIRLTSGKLSDRIGRRESLIIGIIALIISMLMVASAKDIFWYTTSSIVFGIATGINSPTLFAWMADLSPKNRRGIGSGTLFIALELGILFGSACTLALYDSTIKTVNSVFYFGAFLALLALIYTVFHLAFSKTNVNYKNKSS
jgi:MFS family permease